jgi:multiple antibiotic resistance protein
MLVFIKELFIPISLAFMALITVINPLGTGFVLSAMTAGISVDSRKQLARKIVINSLGIFLVVMAFGSYMLSFFGLSLPIIRVGGGLLLAVMGWNMLNAVEAPAATTATTDNSESFFQQAFYPFTFPVTCGPGCIAVIFTLAAHHSDNQVVELKIASLLGTFVGLVGVAIVVYGCYVYSYVIDQKLGESGAQALNRMMAFVTLCIGLQILWVGIQGLAKTL